MWRKFSLLIACHETSWRWTFRNSSKSFTVKWYPLKIILVSGISIRIFDTESPNSSYDMIWCSLASELNFKMSFPVNQLNFQIGSCNVTSSFSWHEGFPINTSLKVFTSANSHQPKTYCHSLQHLSEKKGWVINGKNLRTQQRLCQSNIQYGIDNTLLNQ